MMRRLNDLFGHLMDGLALLGAALLFAMMLMICADVGLRAMNWSGFPWSNDISEYILYGSTFLAAPWLLRAGKHVRLDLILRALPPRIGWYLEWVVDMVGVVVCVTLAVAGTRAVLSSMTNGNVVIKTFAFTEWWLLLPVPVTFVFLAIEFAFRMYRLSDAPHRIRDEATSAS